MIRDGSSPEAQISVEVPDAEGLLRDAYAAIFSRSFVRVLPYYIWAIGVSAFVVFLALVSPMRLFTALHFEILAVIILIVCFSLIWLPGWRARFDRRSALLAGVATAWRFTAERVACSVGGHSSFEADWGAVYSLEKLPDGLLLFTHRIVAHWVPRSTFPDEGSFDQVAEWAAYRAPRYRHRHRWRVAEWIASLLIAPAAVAFTLYFAMLFEWDKPLLDSYPYLAMVFAVALPHSCAMTWLLGAPVYWLLARFTRRPAFFLLAGAALGALQTMGFMKTIIPLQPGLVGWVAAFCAGALVHWLIVVRKA